MQSFYLLLTPFLVRCDDPEHYLLDRGKVSSLVVFLKVGTLSKIMEAQQHYQIIQEHDVNMEFCEEFGFLYLLIEGI